MDKAEKKKQKREARKKTRAERPPSVLKQEFWNVPNVLTLLRILAIPLFVWFTYDADPLYSFFAGLLFAIAALTDVLDGWLARKLNLITVVGKFLDPMADKLIVMAALVMMVRLGRIAAWVVIVLLARELIVGGLRTIAATEGMVIAAGQEGKWKTSLQLVGIVTLCVHYVHPLNLIWWTFPVDYNLIGKTLVYLSTIMSVWSLAVYFNAFLQMLAKRGQGAR